MVIKGEVGALTCLVSLAALLKLTACSSQDKPAVPGGENASTNHAAFATGGPDLLWEELGTGNLGAWILNGSTVTGTQSLSTPVPLGTGGSSSSGSGGGGLPTWKAVDTTGNTLLLAAQPAKFQEWNFDDNGTVTQLPTWSANCDTTCTNGQFQGYIGGNFMWWDDNSGNVEIGLRDGNTIFKTQTVSWQCGAANGCWPTWFPGPRADFNGDGVTDIVWQDPYDKKVGYWLLDSNANVVSAPIIQKQTPGLNWMLVNSAVDLNGDGHVDLTWWDMTGGSGGQVVNWFLDGAGNVTGTSTLSWTCNTQAGCGWRPIGYVRFP